MKKRLFSIFLIGLFLLQSIPMAAATDAGSLLTNGFALLPELESAVIETLYGGDTQVVTYTHTPSDGKQYLLVYLTAQVTSGTLDLDALSVTIGEESYTRLVDDVFLDTHSYSPLLHGTTTIDSSGWIVFEVPDTIVDDDITSDAILSIAGAYETTISDAQQQLLYMVTQNEHSGYVARQEALNASYLATATAGDYTPEDPYIIVNPYEIAPQAALLLFETEDYVSVTTVIQGKGEGLALELSTITNVNTEKNTWHEIPLIGLYEGENTVELQLSDGTTYTHTITTQEVPSNIANSQSTLIYQDLEQLSPGLYQLKDYYRTLWDVNGDLRGYFTESFNTSGVDHLDENGHVYGSSQTYTTYSIIYERDYLGYTHSEIATYNWSTHHDIYPLDNTLITYDQVYDLDTGEITNYVDWSTLFNDTHGSFEVRDLGGWDWNHFNTITDGGDGYILVSFRNLHTVAKLSYPELEVQWVLSVNDQALAEGQDDDLYLTPIGDDFEWFYSQHDVSLVSENADGTIDITVYDNGAQRGLDGTIEDYPTDELYTRMVRYRIDETNMTVEQIWDWGEEYGTAGASGVHGSTQYIAASNSYLGSFDTASNSASSANNYAPDELNAPSKILEVAESGDIIFGLELSSINYRTEKVESSVLYNAFTGIANQAGQSLYVSTTPAQVYDATDDIQWGEAAYQIQNIYATQDYLNISGWVGNSNMLGGYVIQRQVILRNQVTGEAYCYNLEANTAQTQQSDVPEDYRAILSFSAGFSQNHIDIQGLPEGAYSVELVANQNDQNWGVVTAYTLQVGDASIQSTLVTSTDLLASQEATSAVLLRDFEEGGYTFEDPMVVLDPYGVSPLSALIAFETNSTGSVSIEIAGKDDATTITHDFTEATITHTIPIYGLYADTNNQVTMTFTTEDGIQTQSVLYIQTDSLPDDMAIANVSVADTAVMEDGFTYGTVEGGGSYAVDANGDVRWFLTFSLPAMAIKRLSNGNILSGSPTMVEGESVYASLYEFDMLGRVHNEYMVYGAHHECLELPNGDLLVAASRGDTVEDYVVRIDRTTGEIVQDWDFHDILDMDYVSDESWQYHVYNNQTLNNPNKSEEQKWTTVSIRSANDWFHNNALYYIEEENAILASGRMKDAIVKFDADTGEVIWILADPNVEWAQTTYADKMLTPVGDDFEYSYGQHAITMTDDGDILLFDNGNYRSKEYDTALSANDSYSRGVRYHIDEETMTVEQVWEYGKELGSYAYSSYISDIDYLGTDHYLINFGGILGDMATGDRYNASGFLKSDDAIDPQGFSLIVEIKDDVVINQMEITSTDGTLNTFRVERLTPYYEGEGYVDLTMVGQRLGSLEPTEPVEGITVPTPTYDIAYTIKTIEDSGEDVYFDIEVSNFTDYTQYIVLDNGLETLVYNANSVIKYGLDDGIYEIGLLVEDANGSFHYTQLYQHFIVNFQALAEEVAAAVEQAQTELDPATITAPVSVTLLGALQFQAMLTLALAVLLKVFRRI